MSRKLASIQKIIDVSPITGADRIELVHVLGWQCVAKKDEFHAGDECVYFEIDSFLPIRPEFEFLRASGYKNSTLLGEGFLLRTQKFRGEISQGLALPLDAVLSAEQQNALRTADDTIPCGTDVTELLGVRKWEIPERATGSGTIIGEAAGQIPITDETRIQSEPALLEEFAGVPFYITTKLDGTSCSIAMGADRVMRVFGHNYEFADDGKSPFFEYVKKRGLADKLRALMDQSGIERISVQGEFCGEGIQKNPLRLRAPEWFVFTVNEDGKRCALAELRRVADALGVRTVPIEETGDDLASAYPTEAALLERCKLNPCHIYPGAPEGIVIRPIEPHYSPTLGRSLSMKVKNPAYELKHEGV